VLTPAFILLLGYTTSSDCCCFAPNARHMYVYMGVKTDSVDELRNCLRGESRSSVGVRRQRLPMPPPRPCPRFCHTYACVLLRKEMWSFDLKPSANRRSNVGLGTDAQVY
jgi:hypothetical protein